MSELLPVTMVSLASPPEKSKFITIGNTSKNVISTLLHNLYYYYSLMYIRVNAYTKWCARERLCVYALARAGPLHKSVCNLFSFNWA